MSDARTALVVVDVQNVFVEYVGDDGPRVVAAVNEQVAAAVEAGWPIFYLRDFGPIEVPPGDPDRRTSLATGLDVQGTVITKGPGMRGALSGFILLPDVESGVGLGSGGFSELAESLRAADVTKIVVVGIATDVCVSSTAMDAARLGYAVTVPLHATAFVHAHPEGDDQAVEDLRAAGITIVG